MSEFLTPVLIFLGGVLTTIFGWLTARRTAKASVITAETEAEESAAETWQKLYQEMKASLTEQKDEIKELKDSHKRLEISFREKEEREYRLHLDLNAVFDWIETGMKPPPPQRPLYLTQGRKLSE